MSRRNPFVLLSCPGLTARAVRILLLLASIFPFPIAYCQTPISGIVNTYYKVIEVIPDKAGVRVSNPAGLNYNDKVMLIQMKGASINTTNSSSFGNITSFNNAGNYELASICAIVDDTVFFVFTHLNNYDVNGKVQLVKIPQYTSARVVDTLKPAPWDNTSGTGGVLAISVEEDLILEAPIFADSAGFRGGMHQISSGTCGNFIPPAANDYVYNAGNLNPQNGAYKGEGIADVAVSNSGGKGAPANGGGGGNNHNNGGAGGANLTAGGIGGGNSSSGGCTATNPGLPGKALNSEGGNRIFAGGGGGAGHSNFVIPNQRGGGNGGGIVFIEATNLIGNEMKISANGFSGGNALGDGASGGGAGGTILMHVDNYIGSDTIEVKGGAGGLANNDGTLNRCYGGGGGGSGGVIYFSGSIPAVIYHVSGGAAGPEIGRNGCNPAVPSGAGTAGFIVDNYTYRSSLVLENSYCSVFLPVELISFKATYQDGICILKWKIGQPETASGFVVERSADGRNWTDIIPVKAHNNQADYEAVDANPQPRINYYRLRMTDINQVINYSMVLKIFNPGQNRPLEIYPNPAGRKITINGKLQPGPVYLYDLAGKLIWTKQISGQQTITEVELPELQKGIYLIRIGQSTSKITIR